jgi:hypothetical protein
VLPPAVRRRSFRSGYFPASLRLRSTFPFAEPQAEALHISIWSHPNNETNSSERTFSVFWFIYVQKLALVTSQAFQIVKKRTKFVRDYKSQKQRSDLAHYEGQPAKFFQLLR